MRKTFKILMLQQRLLLREGEAPAEPGLESDLMRNSRLGPNLATSPSRWVAILGLRLHRRDCRCVPLLPNRSFGF